MKRRPAGIMREILIVLGVKAVALSVIWWVWFSAPQARHMQMPQERVQQRLIETPAVRSPGISPPSPAGNNDRATH